MRTLATRRWLNLKAVEKRLRQGRGSDTTGSDPITEDGGWSQIRFGKILDKNLTMHL